MLKVYTIHLQSFHTVNWETGSVLCSNSSQKFIVLDRPNIIMVVVVVVVIVVEVVVTLIVVFEVDTIPKIFIFKFEFYSTPYAFIFKFEF